MVYSRISTQSMNETLTQTLLMNRDKLNSLQEQVSSGYKVSQPSDDPIATVGILSSTNNLSEIANYQSNIKAANSEMDVTSTAITNVITIANNVKSLVTQASNATSGSDELTAINDQITQYIQQVKDIGNTKYGSTYVFGGTSTSSPAYTTDSSGNVIYQGTSSTGDYQRKIEISQGVEATINVTGEQLLGQMSSSGPPVVTGSGFLNTLSNIQKALTASPVNYDNISAQLDKIETDTSSMSSIQANVGGIQKRLQMTSNKLTNDNITYTSQKSSLQDIDVAKTVSDLSAQETALQASLQVSAKISQLSLLNYM